MLLKLPREQEKTEKDTESVGKDMFVGIQEVSVRRVCKELINHNFFLFA